MISGGILGHMGISAMLVTAILVLPEVGRFAFEVFEPIGKAGIGRLPLDGLRSPALLKLIYLIGCFQWDPVRFGLRGIYWLFFY